MSFPEGAEQPKVTESCKCLLPPPPPTHGTVATILW